MLDDFKRVDKDRTGYDELVALSKFGRGLVEEYEAVGDEVPDWIYSQIKMIRREIHARQGDTVSAKLAKAKARLASLATPEEKRAAIKAEIDELEARESRGGA